MSDFETITPSDLSEVTTGDNTIVVFDATTEEPKKITVTDNIETRISANESDKLSIADLDDTPADDSETAVTSKWIFDNIGLSPYSVVSSAKSANYTVLDDDGIGTILMTTGSSTDKTVTLPTAADNTDREITILKVDSGTNYCIVDGEGAETIDYLGIQQTTITIELQGVGIKLKCNGTSWNVIQIIGAELNNIGGVLEVVYNKYFSGTLDAATDTTIAHGIQTYTKIISVTSSAFDGSNTRYNVHDYAGAASSGVAYYLGYNTTNIYFFSVGAQLQSQNYKVMIKYYI